MKFDVKCDWKAWISSWRSREWFIFQRGIYNNENFLAMLAAVKYDKANWKGYLIL